MTEKVYIPQTCACVHPTQWPLHYNMIVGYKTRTLEITQYEKRVHSHFLQKLRQKQSCWCMTRQATVFDYNSSLFDSEKVHIYRLINECAHMSDAPLLCHVCLFCPDTLIVFLLQLFSTQSEHSLFIKTSNARFIMCNWSLY